MEEGEAVQNWKYSQEHSVCYMLYFASSGSLESCMTADNVSIAGTGHALDTISPQASTICR